jgi:branched-subunit amino acid aminotransferase/4-amino-4-deoxychorismate lyase
VLLTFDADGRRPSLAVTPPAGDASLAVADSWLVEDGRVRFLDAHRARFTAACEENGLSPAVLSRFWTATLAVVPADGRWFPRAELTVAGALRFRLRPAPEPGREAAVWVADGADPRRRPRTKGPDLEVLARLRTRAAGHGATEALLRTSDGLVLEGATTSLLWWEEDDLCVPDPDLPVLPGTTTRALQDRAAQAGITVRPVRCAVERLAGTEAWLVNALHGIRPVVRWVTADPAAGPARGGARAITAGHPARAPQWQRWLAARTTGPTVGV